MTVRTVLRMGDPRLLQPAIAVTAFAGAYLKQWDLILTSTFIAMLPVIVLYLFAQRYIIKGMVEGSIK